MTYSTPQLGASANSSDCPLLDLSAFSLDHELMNTDRPQASCPPPPRPASRSSEGYDPASSLPLPVLAPRSTTRSRRPQRETNADSPSFMSFVSHMSLNDVASSITSSYASSSAKTPFRPPTSSAPDLEDEEDGHHAEKSLTDIAAYAMEVASGAAKHLEDSTPCSSSQYSLTTPEPTKTVLSTPQVRRSLCQKRKSPMVQCTPVNGNRPLMRLPSLNGKSTACSTPQCPHHTGRSVKKAKNYNTLMNNAPMLPASPDLETRDLAVPRFHPPCFSPPVGGVTLVNPNFRVLATPVRSPPPTARRALPLVLTSAAGLPSLDEIERSAPKWLRMKKRESLLYALRMTATES